MLDNQREIVSKHSKFVIPGKISIAKIQGPYPIFYGISLTYLNCMYFAFTIILSTNKIY